MNVWLFVKVVAVLTDVVQGGEYGCVVSAPALIRHPTISLTFRCDDDVRIRRQDMFGITCSQNRKNISDILLSETEWDHMWDWLVRAPATSASQPLRGSFYPEASGHPL